MTRDVLVSLTGIQFDVSQGDDTPIEVITAGEYFLKNNKHYVVYDEVMEGSNNTVKNTVKFDEKVFSITRRGAVNVQMIFSLEEKTVSTYRTPFGNIFIGIDAQSLDISVESEIIKVEIEYRLDVNNEFLTNCHLKMEIRQKNQGVGMLSK